MDGQQQWIMVGSVEPLDPRAARRVIDDVWHSGRYVSKATGTRDREKLHLFEGDVWAVRRAARDPRNGRPDGAYWYRVTAEEAQDWIRRQNLPDFR